MAMRSFPCRRPRLRAGKSAAPQTRECGFGQRAGQRTEGAWWMPWRLWPTKDVARRRNAAGSCLASGSGGLRMGQPGPGDTESLRSEHIAMRAGTGGTETS